MVSSTKSDLRLRFEYDRKIVEEEIKASNPADTLIIPKHMIYEVYQVFILKSFIKFYLGLFSEERYITNSSRKRARRTKTKTLGNQHSTVINN